jgi:hypothetical protein
LKLNLNLLQVQTKSVVTDWSWFFQNNCRSTAIRAVAKANDIELNIVEAEKGNATVEHLKANGLGKIPAFIGEDGFALSECIAIAIYSKLSCARCVPNLAPLFFLPLPCE